MSKHNSVGFSGPLAETYNARTGGCNVRLANAMLSRTLPHFPTPSTLQKAGGSTLRILDSASGPLVLTTQLLLDHSFLPTYSSPPNSSSIEIIAGEISADFVKANQASLGTAPLYTGLPSNVKVTADSLDGQDLSRFPANHFDASFTSLALFAYPDPAKGARELYRTLKPGGVTSASSWKFLGWHDIFHAVERELGRDGPETRFEMVEAWLPAGKLKTLFEEAGFAGEDVTEEAVPVEAWWGSVEEAAKCIAQSTAFMVAGKDWTKEQISGLEAGYLKVMKERGKQLGLLVEEGTGKAGVRAECWIATAVKK
ncbi:MAG: hypothetical protein OHK93_001986 [Ramalina farinacea]|uniref:Methyltransferase type 11 domain-containing protein n=1 Tax=Ramalina farinacea TaxID=258253 RepID=A0AA43QQN0_9LECA|nr:hypothetical protein [Ramalina farinacea]